MAASLRWIIGEAIFNARESTVNVGYFVWVCVPNNETKPTDTKLVGNERADEREQSGEKIENDKL